MLSAALAVFVRLFLAWKERWWAFYCLVSAVLILLIFFTGFSNAAFMARTLRLATLIGWMAASVIAIKLLCTPDTTQHTRDHLPSASSDVRRSTPTCIICCTCLTPM